MASVTKKKIVTADRQSSPSHSHKALDKMRKKATMIKHVSVRSRVAGSANCDELTAYASSLSRQAYERVPPAAVAGAEPDAALIEIDDVARRDSKIPRAPPNSRGISKSAQKVYQLILLQMQL